MYYSYISHVPIGSLLFSFAFGIARSCEQLIINVMHFNQSVRLDKYDSRPCCGLTNEAELRKKTMTSAVSGDVEAINRKATRMDVDSVLIGRTSVQ